MRVNSVGQENKTTTASGLIKAGGVGAAAGALLGRFAPLTTEEHADYFTTGVQEEIKKVVKKAKETEIDKILEESAKKTRLDINDTAIICNFKNEKDNVLNNPKKALDSVKDCSDAVKSGFKNLLSRVDKAGLTKQHCETHAIKSAAKAARPLAYFALAGALVGMAGDVIKNTAFPKKQNNPDSKKEPLTMADILLEGLGSNTEMLYLTNKRNGRNF